MNEIRFRDATQEDGEVIASLQTENWRNAYRGILPDAYLDGPIGDERAALWQSRLSSPGADRRFVHLAESGGMLIGFVCVLMDEDPLWGACLNNLHVLSQWRGLGLGRQLFSRAAQWVRCTEPGWGIYLWVLEANLNARRFYDALGGKAVERRVKKVAEGIEIPSIRYAWHDLDELLNILQPKLTQTSRRVSPH